MRYKNRLTTEVMLAEALASPNTFEVTNGDESIEIWVSPIGVVFWYVNNRVADEKAAADMLARWAVEGVV